MPCHDTMCRIPVVFYEGYSLFLSSSIRDWNLSSRLSRLATSFSSPSAAASGLARTCVWTPQEKDACSMLIWPSESIRGFREQKRTHMKIALEQVGEPGPITPEPLLSPKP